MNALSLAAIPLLWAGVALCRRDRRDADLRHTSPPLWRAGGGRRDLAPHGERDRVGDVRPARPRAGDRRAPCLPRRGLSQPRKLRPFPVFDVVEALGLAGAVWVTDAVGGGRLVQWIGDWPPHGGSSSGASVGIAIITDRLAGGDGGRGRGAHRGGSGAFVALCGDRGRGCPHRFAGLAGRCTRRCGGCRRSTTCGTATTWPGSSSGSPPSAPP